MYYKMKEIIASLPKEKNDADSYWTRFVLRPISFPITWLLLLGNITPNMTSWLGVFFAILGGLFFSLNFFIQASNTIFYCLGLIFFFLFSVFDCADGNMARTIKKNNPWGSWVDAVGGYIAYTIALLALGLAAEQMNQGLRGLYIFLGGFSASSNMLMRAAVQSNRVSLIKMTNIVNLNPDNSEKRFSEHVGITGAMFPLYGIGIIFNKLHYVLLFYSVIYGFGSIWVLFKFALKTKTNKEDIIIS